MKLALLPLDDRPCNLEAIVDLGRVAGIAVTTPPRALIASHRPGPYDFEATHAWLEAALESHEALVLSLDCWLYGGLIQSRKHDVSETEALRRLERLDRLLARFPKVRVYLSHVLLRLSVTVTASQPESVWRDVFRFSELSDPVESGEATPEERAEWETTQKRIPEAVLREYLEVRARNHALNRAALGLSSRARAILYGQEDSAPRGLHRREKSALRERIATRSTAHIVTGADELNSMLLYRAYAEAQAKPIPLACWDSEGLARVSLYEDIPLRENLEAHLEAMGLRASWLLGSKPELPPEPVLHLIPFSQAGQRDSCFLTPEELDATPLSELERAALARIRPGDGLLDFTHGNGGHPAIARALASDGRLETLSVYSAWNTSGNRMGTAFAHWALRELARARSELNAQDDRWYLHSQILDGWLYQSEVRPRLMAEARARGENPWALEPNAWKAAGLKLQERMLSARERLWPGPLEFRAELPWNRYFEARLEPVVHERRDRDPKTQRVQDS